ncbi:MAG: hypothetical protein F4Z55_16480, partial [Boseongicola sp. SB0667_bin_21]|nr:hypothetical protein [Boseongicola sp. SB0667_bin_21]
MDRPETISDRWEIHKYRSNGKRIEIRNFQKISAILSDWGLHCATIPDDDGGADFTARHMPTHTMIPIQLKGRLTIAQKYLRHENLWMAFPVKRKWNKFQLIDWYLVKHIELVEVVKQVKPNWL